MKTLFRFFLYAALALGLTVLSVPGGIPASEAKIKRPPEDVKGTCTCNGCATNGGDVVGQCSTVCKGKTVYKKGSQPHDWCGKDPARRRPGGPVMRPPTGGLSK